MKHLVWLASYPKSGNTWLRLFLDAYLNGKSDGLDINRIDATTHAANRETFDRVVGFAAADLTTVEILDNRPQVYRAINAEVTTPQFFKVHDQWQLTRSGEPLFAADVTRLAVYIVRDPRAVAPSLANHAGLSLDDALAKMDDEQYALASSTRSLALQLPQSVGRWSTHVASWLDQTSTPVHVMRYEDMHATPDATFGRLLDALELERDDARLANAIGAARFERLQADETTRGFREKPVVSAQFFRKGQTDAWRHELSESQQARIIADHGEVMRRLGYL